MSGRGGTDVPLPREFLDRLVGGVSVRVAVDAEAGDALPWPRMTTRIDELDLEHSDIGIDAALVGLAGKVEAALDDGLLNDCGQEQMLLVLRLHLASSDRALGRLLQRASMLTGDLEHDY